MLKNPIKHLWEAFLRWAFSSLPFSIYQESSITGPSNSNILYLCKYVVWLELVPLLVLFYEITMRILSSFLEEFWLQRIPFVFFYLFHLHKTLTYLKVFRNLTDSYLKMVKKAFSWSGRMQWWQPKQKSNKSRIWMMNSLYLATISDKIFGTKWRNPVKLGRKRKVWYLFLLVS